MQVKRADSAVKTNDQQKDTKKSFSVGISYINSARVSKHTGTGGMTSSILGGK